MPTALQNGSHDTLSSVNARGTSEFGAPRAGVATCVGAAPNRSERIVRLAALLEEDPVDLAQVSDEIRSQPELADVVTRFAASLQLPAEKMVSTVEEAAIILGTERLRVLLQGWPAFHEAFDHQIVMVAAQTDGNRQVHARSPESLYLASVTRLLSLGTHSPADTPPGTAQMSETLLRDLLALLPAIRLHLLSAVEGCRGR